MKRLAASITIAVLIQAGSLWSDDDLPVAEVWIFTAVDCPIANGYAPELNRLRDDYGERRIKFLLVYPEPSISEDEIHEHRSDYELNIPALHDPKHLRVTKAGVTTTPEVAVFDSSGHLVYRGKIDDRYTEFGDRRNAATETYLRDVLDRLLNGEAIDIDFTEPIGCFIEALPAN